MAPRLPAAGADSCPRPLGIIAGTWKKSERQWSEWATLGRFHAQKYALLADCSLVGVVDNQAEAASRVAAEVRAPAYGDFRELLGKVDAVSVATPTPTHYDIARGIPRERRACAGGEADHRDHRPGRTADRRGATVRPGAAGGTSRALQSGHPGRRAAADAAALHRVSPAGAVQGARHRRQCGARPDDSRYRPGADDRRQPGGGPGGDRHAGVFPARSISPMRACASRAAASPT